MKIEIYPNVITKEDINKLMVDLNPKDNAEDMKYFVDISDDHKCKKKECTDHQLVKRISDQFQHTTEYASIAYYPTGSYNPQHADNCIIQNNIVTRVKNWSHTGIIFLNDDFEGGNLVYPNQGCVFVPTIGTMIIAPAGEDYIHFVEQVTKGERFTLVFRFI
jgi:predicted 2-oxoglutarate/Fe(II)-dependent dioxygenase YbiX